MPKKAISFLLRREYTYIISMPLIKWEKLNGKSENNN